MSYTPINTTQLPFTDRQSSTPSNQPHSRRTFRNHSNASARHEPSTEEPAFVCTICWQAQPSPAKPKLLGTSARIVCRSCWRAVLDLSICWVCGECIVRGDEVVSLGWCFWHRACFGCLICGTGMCIPKSTIEDGDDLDVDTDEADQGGTDRIYDPPRDKTRCMGIELEEIPLCNVCTIETAGESKNQVLQKGIDTVSRFDGGLSRDRLLMMSEDNDLRLSAGRKLPSPRRVKAKSCQDSSIKPSRDQVKKCPHGEEDDKIPLLQAAAAMGVSNDYNTFEVHYHSDSEQPHFGNVKPEIFVSILDPFKDPPFIPSQTKRQPQWMDLLPCNVYRERERRELKSDNPHDSFGRATQESRTKQSEKSSALNHKPRWPGAGIQVMAGGGPKRVTSPPDSDPTTPTQVNHSEMLLAPTRLRKPSFDSTTIPTTPISVVDGPSTIPKHVIKAKPSYTASRTKSTVEDLSTTSDFSASPNTQKNRHTTISFDPKVKRELALDHLDEATFGRKRCRTKHPATNTSIAVPARNLTPFPILDISGVDKGVDYFTSYSKTTAKASSRHTEKGAYHQTNDRRTGKAARIKSLNTRSPEDPDSTANPTPVSKLVPPPLLSNSSEYLERYKPITPAANSKIEKYVAKPPQSVMEKVRRRRAVSDGSTKGPGDFEAELEGLFSKKQVEVKGYVEE